MPRNTPTLQFTNYVYRVTARLHTSKSPFSELAFYVQWQFQHITQRHCPFDTCYSLIGKSEHNCGKCFLTKVFNRYASNKHKQSMKREHFIVQRLVKRRTQKESECACAVDVN